MFLVFIKFGGKSGDRGEIGGHLTYFSLSLKGIKVNIRNVGAVENGEIASSLRFSQRHKVRFSLSCSC